MFNQQVYSELVSIVGSENIKINEPMSSHTSFKVGGNTDYFVRPINEEQLVSLVKYVKEREIKYYLIGNGSNLLVKDSGFDGVIIQVYKNFNLFKLEDNVVTVGAGILLTSIANKLYNNELRGFEFASGIPGTLGGAVCMNAGAYGGEIKDCIISARVIDNEGNIIELSKEELKLGYRTSIVLKKGYIVISAKMEFEKSDKEDIKAKMNDYLNRRKTKQPLELPSAGSTFKRPEGYFAGKLIMDAGLKGYSVGGAKVSEKHCGFIVNHNKASATDILKLIDDVQKIVYNKFGVVLETEVRIIG